MSNPVYCRLDYSLFSLISNVCSTPSKSPSVLVGFTAFHGVISIKEKKFNPTVRITKSE